MHAVKEKFITKLISRVSRLGSTHALSYGEKKRLALTNWIATILFIITFLATINAYFNVGNVAGILRLAGCALLSFAILVCNYYHRYLAAKLLLALGAGFILLLLPLITGNVLSGHLLWFPYAAMGLSFVPILIFSYKRNRFLVLSVSTFYFLLVCFLDHLLIWRATQPLQDAFILSHYSFYKIPQIAITLLIGSAILWAMRNNEVYERTLEQLNGKLQEKNEAIYAQTKEIVLQNETLHEKQAEIIAMNENLELLVAERSKVLEQRNRQIIEYAYYNSHKVRGPLARILGLVNLAKIERQDADLLLYMEKIGDNSEELNEILTKINHILEEAE